MLEAGTLIKAPGIGKGSLARIKEIIETGTCAEHRDLRAQLPPGALQMMRVEGMGPKKVALVYRELGVENVDQLEEAARTGKLASLPRMGARTEAKLLAAIEAYRRRAGRTLLGEALPQGRSIAAALRLDPAVERVALCGSSRRGRDTIGDLDILVASTTPARVMDSFVGLPEVEEVMLRGETKCSVRLRRDMQVDLRVVAPESFGAALHYFTGSQLHNIAIRDRGKRQGLRINEYGVFDDRTGERHGGEEEQDVFSAVGLPYIPPELREGSGEIEAAAESRLPELITEAHLRGELHMHTDASDGKAPLERMARAAVELGHEYIAVTDHSKALAMVQGLDEVRLAAQVNAVRALEQQLGSIRILAGIEVDILADGSLDLTHEALRELDWVVASIHSHFNMPRELITHRIVTAIETGLVDCIGHPTGRILGHRDEYNVDLERVMRAAAERGVALELNAFPDRLDLSAEGCRQAKDSGVRVTLNTDAHAPGHFRLRELGILTARRGWLGPADVLNTRPVAEIEAFRAARL
jgi:DNA polymerase (family 10)